MLSAHLIRAKYIQPVFTNCPISGAVGQYYRSELDVETALVFFEHLRGCSCCSEILRNALHTDMKKQPESAALGLLMDASNLTAAQRKQALDFEKVHGADTAMDYVALMHLKNQA